MLQAAGPRNPRHTVTTTTVWYPARLRSHSAGLGYIMTTPQDTQVYTSVIQGGIKKLHCPDPEIATFIQSSGDGLLSKHLKLLQNRLTHATLCTGHCKKPFSNGEHSGSRNHTLVAHVLHVSPRPRTHTYSSRRPRELLWHD
jgi:hypothetical protein